MGDLEPLPPDDDFVEAVHVILAERHPLVRHKGVTANEVAYELRVKGARRLGNGAVKGTWSGYASGALRTAPRLAKLAREGRLRQEYDASNHRQTYLPPRPRSSAMTYPPITVPQNWRIEREEHEDYLRNPGDTSPGLREVSFAVIDVEDDDHEVSRPSARYDRRAGEWTVHPGSSTNRIPPDEALARAAALMMAAQECEERNDAVV